MSWEIDQIGNLATVVRGASPRPMGDPRYFGGTIPWVKISDVSASNGRILLTTKNGVTKAGMEKSRLVKKGELIVSNSGTVGKPIFMGIDGCIHDGFLTFLDISGSVTKDWLYWFFIWYQDRIESKANTGTQLNLNTTIVKSLKIPLPPLPIQKKIAAILDAADAYRQKTKALIEKYDELIQSIFFDMHESAYKLKTKVGNLSIDGRGTFSNGPFGSDLLTSELTDSGQPVVYIRDIASGAYVRKSTVFVTHQKFTQLATSQVFPGDILIAKVGSPPGTTAIYPLDEEVGIITQDVIRIRPKKELIHPLYFKVFMNSPLGIHALRNIIVEGTRMRFGLKDFKGLIIEIPELSIQTDIGNRIKKIEEQKSITYKSLKKADDLFQSLLQRAFKGELIN